MLVALAVNDPPLQLELRRSIYVERNVADLVNRSVETDKVGKRFLVLLPVMTPLEHESGFGSLIRDCVRSYEREVVLRAKKLGQLIVELHLLFGVIRTPHRSVEPRNFVRIKAAHPRRTRHQKIKRRVDKQAGDDHERDLQDPSPFANRD